MSALKLEIIQSTIEQNSKFSGLTDCKETMVKTVSWYKTIGFELPWVGYFAFQNGKPVGSCAFKGPPRNGKVEIAYVTFDQHRNKGLGSAMCRSLLDLARSTDSEIIVTARTLQESGHSTRILEKNGFVNAGEIIDHDGTPVWEWVLKN